MQVLGVNRPVYQRHPASISLKIHHAMHDWAWIAGRGHREVNRSSRQPLSVSQWQLGNTLPQIRSAGRAGNGDAHGAPVLVLAGDEDDGCLETSVWLKRVIPTAGLAVLAKSGHTLNIEEPDLVNTLIADFLSRVAAGAWGPRDQRARPRSHHRLLLTASADAGPPPPDGSLTPPAARNGTSTGRSAAIEGSRSHGDSA